MYEQLQVLSTISAGQGESQPSTQQTKHESPTAEGNQTINQT